MTMTKSKGSKGNVRRTTRAQPKAKNFTFAAGEMTLPRKAIFVAVTTSKDCDGTVKVPIPDEDDDYADGKVAGWLVTASFAETGKAKFAGAAGFFPTATIKIPAERRSQDLTLRVVGQPSETYGVCFTVTPKIVNEVVFGL